MSLRSWKARVSFLLLRCSHPLPLCNLATSCISFRPHSTFQLPSLLPFSTVYAAVPRTALWPLKTLRDAVTCDALRQILSSAWNELCCLSDGYNLLLPRDLCHTYHFSEVFPDLRFQKSEVLLRTCSTESCHHSHGLVLSVLPSRLCLPWLHANREPLNLRSLPRIQRKRKKRRKSWKKTGKDMKDRGPASSVRITGFPE